MPQKPPLGRQTVISGTADRHDYRSLALKIIRDYFWRLMAESQESGNAARSATKPAGKRRKTATARRKARVRRAP